MQSEVLQATIHHVLDRLSNSEPVEIKEEWIQDAGEQFKDALRKQTIPRDHSFRVRMSNIGRPLCQLQMDKSEADKSRMSYNFVVRMLMGDASECIARFFLKAAGIEATSDGDKVKLDVDGQTVKGESDIDIDNEVWDVKSCSTWAYDNKWSKGYQGLRDEDNFGYVGQLFGYADAQDKETGGWIVIDKSNGYVNVVPVTADDADAKKVREERVNTVRAIRDDAPFERCFEAETEYFRKEPTGAKKLCNACSFCDYKAACWPTLKKLTPHMSKAKSPAYHWYVEHPDIKPNGE
jgi:hypothetical protein